MIVRNGPDVPECLLQVHEDRRLASLFGAGISYPAGLPSFVTLVEQIYHALDIAPDPVQRASCFWGSVLDVFRLS